VSLLEVGDVQSGYGKLPVLHGVSISAEKDEIVAVVGPNGAGKTTLMRTIFRLLPLMTGSVQFDGRNLRAFEARELAALGMGFVPQGGGTFPDLSVEDNLKVALVGKSRRDASEGLERMYETFPVLANRRRQRAKTLSGGERQMLALAGAMITSPRFLALDEPAAGLAPTIVQGLIRQILEFRKQGTAVLWVVEENPLQVLEYVDRVYLLQGGVIERELAASELLADESLQDLFFGTQTATPAPKAEKSANA
jgi:branched-chain amino acid transport system ATP-binding protein